MSEFQCTVMAALSVCVVCSVSGPALVQTVYAGQPSPTAVEVLNRYTEALEARQSFISKSEVLSRQDFKFDAGFDPAHLGTPGAVDRRGLELHQRVEFRTDGRRTRRILYMWGDTGINSSHDEARPSYFFSQWDGNNYYVHSSDANDPVRRGVIQLGGITKDQWETQFIRHSESWLLGYHGDERLDAMLRKAGSLTVSEKMEDVLFTEIDGVWVPMEADTLKQVDYSIRGKKGYTHEQSHHRRTQFLLNPDHDALGSFADPFKGDPHLLDETTVHKHGDPRPYIWQDGKAVLDKRLHKRR